jgi:hypothetical protein
MRLDKIGGDRRAAKPSEASINRGQVERLVTKARDRKLTAFDTTPTQSSPLRQALVGSRHQLPTSYE